MKEQRPLSSTFAAHWPGTAGTEALESLLADTAKRAAAAWPSVRLEPAAFVRALAAHVPAQADPADAIRRLHTDDLYLAVACAAGEAPAIAAFEVRFLALLPTYVGRMRLPAHSLDELRQVLRERMLVACNDGPPRIAEYSGRGSLEGWVRIAALRMALNSQRDGKKERSEPDAARVLASTPDPELAMISRQYAPVFSEAFREALAELSPRDRNLLRMHFIDGLGLRQVATIYGVHRVTVSRWLASAQDAVLEATRARVRERLRLRTREWESLMGIIESQLNVTLQNLMPSREA